MHTLNTSARIFNKTTDDIIADKSKEPEEQEHAQELKSHEQCIKNFARTFCGILDENNFNSLILAYAKNNPKTQSILEYFCEQHFNYISM
jgi:indole-3-glycerol phosphate synthase